MTLKLRVSFYLALFAGMLTLVVGVMSQVTLTVVLYRTLVSVVLFAILGYTSGQFAERYLQEQLDEAALKSSHIDSVNLDKNGDELPTSEFTPLNPDNFENITLTQK